MNLFLKPNSEKRFLIEAVNLDSGNFFSKYVFGSINGNVSFQFVQLEIAYTIELRPAQHFLVFLVFSSRRSSAGRAALKFQVNF